MPIAFDADRWEQVLDTHTRWWNHELGRPLLHLTLGGADPGRPEPAVADRPFASHYDLGVPPADIVDAWDYRLSGCRWLADGFPNVWPNFGPGIAATFMGAELQNAPEVPTTWFAPREHRPITDIHLEHDPENPWLPRIAALYRAALERWEGNVQLSMTDLGGNLDLVSTFRPSEELLFDLIDEPEEVKRVNWEAHDLWWRYFEEFNDILQPINPGYTAWTPILSETPYYILQCDFCYMIGPDMFDEFVKPELAATCAKLDNAFYHLDGPGQLPHLDSLLEIEELAGVQWVPGDGQPDWTHWPQVYRKIRDAGKLIQIPGNFAVLDTLAEQIGTAERICFISGVDVRDAAAARDFAAKWGAR